MRFLNRASSVVSLLAVLSALILSLACGGGGGGGSTPTPPSPPAISAQPANQTVLEGATATFTATATGTGPLTYQWKKGGTAIAGATSASYTTPATVLADSGSSFTLTVSNAGGAVTSNAATLTVNPAPAIASFTATPGAVTLGGSATLAFTFSGGTGSVDQGIGAVASGATLTVTPAVTTTYVLTVDNGAGTSVTASATVIVAPAPLVPTITAPALASAGATGFTASIAPQAGMTYAWTITGGTITAGAATPQITFTAGAAGTLTLACTVSNAALATAVGTTTVDVVAAPQATALAASSTTPLYGATVTLTPTFSGGTGVVDHGIGTVTSGTAYPTPALLAEVTYTLTVTNLAGAVATTAVTVRPQTVTVAAISPATPMVTALATQNFTSSVSGALDDVITWSATGGTMDPATGAWAAPAAPGPYTITATSHADISRSATTVATVVPAPAADITTVATAAAGRKGITASVPAQPDMTFAWTITGGTFTSATNTNQVVYTADSAGTLVLGCTVTNGAGTGVSRTASVDVLAIPWINAYSATPPAVVSGGAATLHFDFVGGTGSIDNGVGAVTSLTDVVVNPVVTTVYTLTVTPASGSPITQALTVTVGTMPSFTQNLPATLTATQGTNATMTVNASASPAITGYQWYFNGVLIPDKTEATLILYSVAPSASGSYHVVATNLVGSTQSATLALTVNPIHTISGRVGLVGDGTAIPGVTVTLDTTPTPTTVVTGSNGTFAFPGLLGGSYTLTPSMPAGTNVLFLPASLPVTVSGGVNALDRDIQAALGYTVSGTVSYGGLATGRVYLRLDGGSSGIIPGVSVAGAGGFEIRGVPPGTYTLRAWMDTQDKGNPNAANPIGSLANVVVGFGDVAGADLLLADPAAVDLTALTPSPIKVTAMAGGAVVRWNALKNAQNVEVAQSYLVEWSTSNTFASVTGNASVPAMGQEHPVCFVPSLTNGTSYYFRLFGKAQTPTSSTSAASAIFGPVTPSTGGAVGTYIVSGTVTFPGTATGLLHVGLFNQDTQTPYVASYSVPPATPPAPTTRNLSYSLSGVPAGPSYFLFAILDQNSNGLVDLGDFSNISAGDIARPSGNTASLLAISSDLPGQHLLLPGNNAIAYLGTSHQSYTVGSATSETFGLQVDVRGNTKLPVNTALLVGPATLDLGRPATGGDFGGWFNHGSLRPSLGDVVTARVGYGDATSEDFPVTVASVLDAFPSILAMTGTPAVPTFNWAAPDPAPGFPYSYRLWIALKAGGTIWQYPSDRDMPSTQLSVAFNADGLATPATLTPGLTYMWSISLRDASGNSAEKKVDHTP
ncbi:MAG TPA: immunoglobulin domain-containing protein [Geothrix sp.]|nr:immunoglobulin domain-containing protein [Geothrix sp.]